MKQKTKLIIVLALEFVAVSIILLLIFFAGKKSYTVTFDLDGGILLSGETVQRVTQGQNATPPNVAKDGHYLMGWSGNYRKVTADSVVRAIWEYETTPGIIYGDATNQNFAEIIGSYKGLQGDVYIGAYHDEKIVLSINEGAFRERRGITSVHLLDGILAIEESAFEGCSALESIELPETVTRLGKNVFKDCVSLKSITLPSSLIEIEEGAFAGCTSLEEIIFVEEEIKIKVESDENDKKDKNEDKDEDEDVKIEVHGTKYIGAAAFSGCTSLKTVILPESLISIDTLAFEGCTSLEEITIPSSVLAIGVGVFNTDNLTINLYFSESETPEGFMPLWYSGEGITLVYGYQPPEPEEEEDEEKDPWWHLGGKDEDDSDKQDK